jgi:hypothetical protein
VVEPPVPALAVEVEVEVEVADEVEVPPPAEPTDPLAAGSIPKIALQPPTRTGARPTIHFNALDRDAMR